MYAEFPGKSGREYAFELHSMDYKFTKVPVLYIFAKYDRIEIPGLFIAHKYKLYYIGKITNLSTQLETYTTKYLQRAKNEELDCLLIHTFNQSGDLAESEATQIKNDLLLEHDNLCDLQDN